MGGVTDEGRLARVLLSRLAEPGDRALGRLVRDLGPTAVVESLRDGTCPAPNVESLRTRLPHADPEQDVERARAVGARLLVPGDSGWPTQVDQLGTAAPLLLWASGAADLRLLAVRSVAVVGARAATPYGEAVARTLAADLAERGWAVVSGGAFGIDAAAHRGALDAGGVTGCVLAGGVDVPYPKAHEGLLARIADEGVLVSESPPGAASLRTRFLSRNRLIAALSRATVLVEAAVRSGTTSTANAALALNRPLLAVPGPVTSPMSAGVHQLLRGGRAQLVTAADEVVEVVGELGRDAVAEQRGDVMPWDALGPDERRVFEALPLRRPAAVEELVVVAGVPARTVLAALGVLRAARLARPRDGGWVKSGAGSARTARTAQGGSVAGIARAP